MYLENYGKMRIKWFRDEITLEEWYYFCNLCLEELTYNTKFLLEKLKEN